VTLTDFYNEVAKQADTDTLKIGAADTKRVLAVAFSVLHTLPTATVLELLGKGLATAAKKQK
jgi:hypothetical protein